MKYARTFSLMSLLTLVAAFFASSAASFAAPIPPRERLLIDFGWKFHLGNDWGIGQNLAKSGTGYGPASADYSDATWRRVNLPHDWAVELPFDPTADTAMASKRSARSFHKIAWAGIAAPLTCPRATWAGELVGIRRRLSRQHRFCERLGRGRQESGYTGFRVDVTDVVNCGGSNVVSVRVDASQMEGWFYEGAGIYRHVWLVKTAPVAIAPDGIFVYSTFANAIPQGPAQLHLETRVNNAGAAPSEVKVQWEVLNPAGTVVIKDHNRRLFPRPDQPSRRISSR